MHDIPFIYEDVTRFRVLGNTLFTQIRTTKTNGLYRCIYNLVLKAF